MKKKGKLVYLTICKLALGKIKIIISQNKDDLKSG